MPDEPAYMKKFDPRLFEWEPADAEDIPEEELFADLAAIGKGPDFFADPEARKRYVAYLARSKVSEP